MAKRKHQQNLSHGEFRLMGIIWNRGPLTLAEVFESQSGNLAYTTIQTQLNRLVAKRMLARSRGRPMKYRAIIDSSTATNGILQILIQSVGGGCLVPLVEQLLSCVSVNKAEAEKLKKLIDLASRQRTGRSKSADRIRPR